MTTSGPSGREMSGGKTPLPNEGAFRPRPLFESEGKLYDKKYIPGLRIFGGLTDREHGLSLSSDLTSAVNLGMVKSYSRSAINVIDDDGAVYTFVYDNRPDSDWGFWKQEDDDHWHQWAFGVQQPSHMEVLASCGFYALKDLGKL